MEFWLIECSEHADGSTAVMGTVRTYSEHGNFRPTFLNRHALDSIFCYSIVYYMIWYDLIERSLYELLNRREYNGI